VVTLLTAGFNIKQFLGVFGKLRKATIGHIMSVRPSAWNSAVPTERIFMKFDI
jgi:hypothetical protein